MELNKALSEPIICLSAVIQLYVASVPVPLRTGGRRPAFVHWTARMRGAAALARNAVCDSAAAVETPPRISAANSDFSNHVNS